MQYYFIGGLGGNGSHLAPLIEKLGFPVTFLGHPSDRSRDRVFLRDRGDRWCMVVVSSCREMLG